MDPEFQAVISRWELLLQVAVSVCTVEGGSQGHQHFSLKQREKEAREMYEPCFKSQVASFTNTPISLVQK